METNVNYIEQSLRYKVSCGRKLQYQNKQAVYIELGPKHAPSFTRPSALQDNGLFLYVTKIEKCEHAAVMNAADKLWAINKGKIQQLHLLDECSQP